MSSCLILQQHDRIFIGADTASSICINGKFIRHSEQIKKLFIIENAVIFCSGILSEVKHVIEYLKQNINDLISVSEFLKKTYSEKKEVYSVELLIAKINNGASEVYQLSEYNNFDILIHEISLGNTKVLSGGLKTEECCNIAIKHINNKEYVNNIFQKTFNEMSCNEIGGTIEVYDVSINGISKRYENLICENNITTI